jgi:predicted Kef-type K+ transport protein
LFVFGKPALAAATMRMVGYDMLSSVRAAAVLAHASELTLLILTQAMSASLVPAGAAQAMLVAAALSMGLAPVIIRHNRMIAIRVLRALERFGQRARRLPYGIDQGASGPPGPGPRHE